MTKDPRPLLTEAGYIAIGFGVIGFQKAQVRRRDFETYLQSQVAEAAARVNKLTDEARNRIEPITDIAKLLAGEAVSRTEPLLPGGGRSADRSA
ncbi:MAG: hypothetical protein KAZ88_10970 [Acidimicrobiia bacterium]|jgi:hypothetical protein|nr:hypothetical protein [Acidimicrobiia bacterium]MBP8181502.1 hypothetical protein [Acidimicrobiia bacterium]